MEAKDYVVNEVLRDPRRFMVPIYQRRYQWGEAELTPFWHDVVAKADEALSGQIRFQHYMGALILAPGGDGYQVGVTPRIQVVDGQQRLTTFQLFLAALREVATRRGVEEIAANIRSYLFNQPMVCDDDPLARYKLSPTPADRTLVHEILDLPADDIRGLIRNIIFRTAMRDWAACLARWPPTTGSSGGSTASRGSGCPPIRSATSGTRRTAMPTRHSRRGGSMLCSKHRSAT